MTRQKRFDSAQKHYVNVYILGIKHIITPKPDPTHTFVVGGREAHMERVDFGWGECKAGQVQLSPNPDRT